MSHIESSKPNAVKPPPEIPDDRPAVNLGYLTGPDGNAFVTLGRCATAAKKAGWSEAQRDAFHELATSGDYDNLLAAVKRYFTCYVDGRPVLLNEQEGGDA